MQLFKHQWMVVLLITFFVVLIVYGILTGDLTQTRLEGGTL